MSLLLDKTGHSLWPPDKSPLFLAIHGRWFSRAMHLRCNARQGLLLGGKVEFVASSDEDAERGVEGGNIGCSGK